MVDELRTVTDTETQSEFDSYTAFLLDQQFVTVVSVAVIGMLALSAISPVLPAISSQFVVSSARVGLVMTAFTVPIIVAAPVAGILADVYGRRPVIIPSLFVFGGAGVTIMAAPSFAAILALRVVQGAAFAGLMPLTVTILGDLYSGTAGSAAQGLRVSANGIADTIAPALIGLLVGVGWNYPFALYGLAFPTAVVVYIVLPETGRTAGEDFDLLPKLRSYARSIWTEVDDRESRILLFGGFVRDFVRLALITFVPLFAVRALEATAFQAGVAIGMLGVSRVVVAPLAGSVVRRCSQRTALAVAFAVCAVGTLPIALSPSIPVLWVLVGIFGVGDSLLSPVLKSAVTELTVSEYRAGVITGLRLLKSLGQSLAPIFFGIVLAGFGFTAVFVLAALIAASYVGILLVAIKF
ncbi:MAG: MFS transporter [Halapricum sp.]